MRALRSLFTKRLENAVERSVYHSGILMSNRCIVSVSVNYNGADTLDKFLIAVSLMKCGELYLT